jgi:carbon-monoxide dehydrogenase small subunit
VGYVEGSTVETIESIRETKIGQTLVDTFAAHGAVQCGFCIPGMIIAGYRLLKTSPTTDDATIREAISGNLCRCTGYDRIVAAIAAAAQEVGDG